MTSLEYGGLRENVYMYKGSSMATKQPTNYSQNVQISSKQGSHNHKFDIIYFSFCTMEEIPTWSDLPFGNKQKAIT